MLISSRTFVSFALSTAISAIGASAQQKSPEPYAVVHGWPVLPDGMVLGQVSGVAVDSHNHVFVFHRAEGSWATDKTHAIVSPTILCLDGASGKLLASWGENRFLEPHGLRVDAHDNVWVTDRALQQVFKFSHDGKLLLTIGTERVAGVDATHFDKPTDIAFASDGSFYVSDGYGNNRVAKFSPDGKFLFDWGHKGQGPGEFDLTVAVSRARPSVVTDCRPRQSALRRRRRRS